MNKTFILILAIVTLAGCTERRLQQTPTAALSITDITGIGKVIPQGGIIELASPVSGIVSSVSRSEGSAVKKGDVIVYLDNKDELLSVQEISHKIVTQQKAVESQKWLIEQKKTALADMLRRLTDSQDLLQSGATTGENVRILQNDYDQAYHEIIKLETDFAMQQSLLNEIHAQRARSMNNLEQTALKVPFNGTVLDILPKPGEAISQLQVYARIAPDTAMIVQAEIDEIFASKLTPGQICTVRLTGESEPVAKGRIIRVSADLKKKSLFSDGFDDLEDRRVREAEISLDTVFTELLINTKVECTIQIN